MPKPDNENLKNDLKEIKMDHKNHKNDLKNNNEQMLVQMQILLNEIKNLKK